MTYRIAVGLLSQESNSFAPTPTVLETFRQCLFLRGEELLRPDYQGMYVAVPGFLSVPGFSKNTPSVFAPKPNAAVMRAARP